MSFAPLSGTRVLDLTSVVVGPAATWRLAQYGAEVLKIESPDHDLMRGLGGPSPSGLHSGTYLHLNRGKQNICLDLKTKGAREILERLIEGSDVVVANMRLPALKKLGLDPEDIRRRWPEKVYCLLTGFGTEGPYSGLPAYDSVIQAAAGIPSLVAERDGTPRYLPLLICDHVVGEIAAGAIVAAVLQQRCEGRGALLEIPMFETMAAFVLQEHLAQQSFDPPTGPAGDQRLLSPHNMPVETADGHIAVTINTDAQVRAFLEVTGRAEMREDPRFTTVAARAENVADWFELRGAPLKQATTREWLERLRAADLAAMPCHTLKSLQEDPHLEAVGLLSEEDHPTEGRVKAIRSALRVDGHALPKRRFSVPPGYDTNEVLRTCGYDDTQINAFLNQGVAYA